MITKKLNQRINHRSGLGPRFIKHLKHRIKKTIDDYFFFL